MDWDRVRSTLRTYHGVLATGASSRLALFALAPALCDALQRRPELSTPITSFRSLKEGVYIYERGTNPYEGGVFYHSPLYLVVFSYLIPVFSHLYTAIVWTAIDAASAVALVKIWMAKNPKSDMSRAPLISALYLFNPYTLLTCLAKSTTSLDSLVVLLTVSSAATGHSIAALTLLAISAHMSCYPALLLPPVVMLLRATCKPSPPATLAVAGFALAISALAALNYLLVGQAWVPQSLGVITNVADLTPNVGMWWYFFTEMFDHFRAFFLGVFQLHHLIYVAPLCIRLSDDPLFIILILVGIISTWKSYPALGDMALWGGLLACFPEVVSNLRHPLFTLAVHLYTSILLPLLHSLWLLTGTGNANFFYAATMVYGLNACLAVVDVLGAGLRMQVKRRGTEALLQGGLEDHSETPGETDYHIIDRIWEKKGWSVVQFTGQLA